VVYGLEEMAIFPIIEFQEEVRLIAQELEMLVPQGMRETQGMPVIQVNRLLGWVTHFQEERGVMHHQEVLRGVLVMGELADRNLIALQAQVGEMAAGMVIQISVLS
jgi:hypothetical protein